MRNTVTLKFNNNVSPCDFILFIKHHSINVNRYLRMCGTISRTLKGKTQLSTQIKLYMVIAVPVLMYGSENWSLIRSDKRKIEAAEMRFLRPTSGYTLLDKKRSTDIREQLGIFNLNAI